MSGFGGVLSTKRSSVLCDENSCYGQQRLEAMLDHGIPPPPHPGFPHDPRFELNEIWEFMINQERLTMSLSLNWSSCSISAVEPAFCHPAGIN